MRRCGCCWAREPGVGPQPPLAYQPSCALCLGVQYRTMCLAGREPVPLLQSGAMVCPRMARPKRSCPRMHRSTHSPFAHDCFSLANRPTCGSWERARWRGVHKPRGCCLNLTPPAACRCLPRSRLGQGCYSFQPPPAAQGPGHIELLYVTCTRATHAHCDAAIGPCVQPPNPVSGRGLIRHLYVRDACTCNVHMQHEGAARAYQTDRKSVV